MESIRLEKKVWKKPIGLFPSFFFFASLVALLALSMLLTARFPYKRVSIGDK
ncbi:hypothetical protein NY10_2124 [Carnobacterium antarcticum]|nr:hypothetical protein NY10_2124 [Carnobacterium sp. CP1]